MNKFGFLVGVTLVVTTLVGCSNKDVLDQNAALKKEITDLKQTVENIKPGLGEIMTTIHLHHAKLYFSGIAENWDLAAYQLDEIKEGLDQATQLHDQFKEVKASLKELKHFTDQGLNDVDSAIKSKSKPKFISGFKNLTQSCNQCHMAAEHPFIVVQIPTTPMFSNQSFTVQKASR